MAVLPHAPAADPAPGLEEILADLVEASFPPVPDDEQPYDLDAALRAAAATHPACPKVALAGFAQDPARAVRDAAQAARLLRSRTCERAAAGAGPRTAAAAAHPAAHPETLRRLAHDPAPDVRVAAALHPACPDDALHVLARDPDPRVRLAVAANPTCGDELELVLTRDPEAAVGAAATFRLRLRLRWPLGRLVGLLPDRWAPEDRWRARPSCTRRLRYPETALAWLSAHPSAGVREEVLRDDRCTARRPRTPRHLD